MSKGGNFDNIKVTITPRPDIFTVEDGQYYVTCEITAEHINLPRFLYYFASVFSKEFGWSITSEKSDILIAPGFLSEGHALGAARFRFDLSAAGDIANKDHVNAIATMVGEALRLVAEKYYSNEQLKG